MSAAADPLERIITADDLIRGGCCRSGVMQSATPEWPAAFTVRAALAEAGRRKNSGTVRKALSLDGYGDGYGDSYGYGYGDGYGDSYGYRGGYGWGYRLGDG